MFAAYITDSCILGLDYLKAREVVTDLSQIILFLLRHRERMFGGVGQTIDIKTSRKRCCIQKSRIIIRSHGKFVGMEFLKRKTK